MVKKKKTAQDKVTDIITWFRFNKIPFDFSQAFVAKQIETLLEILSEQGGLNREAFDEEVAAKMLPLIEGVKTNLLKQPQSKIAVPPKKLILPD